MKTDRAECELREGDSFGIARAGEYCEDVLCWHNELTAMSFPDSVVGLSADVSNR